MENGEAMDRVLEAARQWESRPGPRRYVPGSYLIGAIMLQGWARFVGKGRVQCPDHCGNL